MERFHVTVLTLLGSAHVYPTLGLCAELVSRGYRVSYVTSDHFAERIREVGAEALVFPAPEQKNTEKISRFPLDQNKFWPMFSSLYCPSLLTMAACTVEALQEFYQRNPPDLIIYDRFSFAGRILAERHRCPAVQIWAHFAHHDHIIREGSICLNPEPMLGFSHLLDSFLSMYGVHTKNNIWYTERLNIYFVPREFQFDAESFDDRTCFVGVCLNRPGRSPWSGAGKKVILISESETSTHDHGFLGACIDALAGSQYRVVVSLAVKRTEGVFKSLPQNFEINRDAYNIQILPHALLTISQAGMGTPLESLYYGVPVLAVPRSPYHAEVAYRLAELGVGAYLPESELSAEAVRRRVDEILSNSELLSRVKLMQKASRRSGGAVAAANRIEELVQRA